MTDTQAYETIPVGLAWYRLCVDFTGGGSDHFYTTSAQEADDAVANLGYTIELRGVGEWGAAGWLLPNGSGQTPLYRAVWEAGSGRRDHFYTIDPDEIVSPYTQEGGGPIGEVYTGTAQSVPSQAVAMYRARKEFPSTGSFVDHMYSTAPLEMTGAGYTLEANGQPYFWIMPARSTFRMSEDGKSIVAGPTFTSGNGITYSPGDIEMVNDQTAAWVRPRAVMAWTFERLQWEDSQGNPVAAPSMMTTTTQEGMIRIEDKDVNNTTSQQYIFSVWTQDLGPGTQPYRVDPKVVNKPTTGSVIN